MSLIASVLCAQFNQKKKIYGKETPLRFCVRRQKRLFFNVGGKIK